MFCR